MKKLRTLLLLGGTLLLGVAPLAAQNSVDVLDGGPQPPDAPMPAIWSSTSNGAMDITSPIVAHFVYAGTADTPTSVPAAVSGQICLVQAGGLTGVYSVQANSCAVQGAIAVLIFNTASGAINSPSTIPVFAMANADGVFLRDTVGSDQNTLLSKDRIRINVAPVPANPTGQHNCPGSQAVVAYVGPGIGNYTRNESLCLPAGAGQAGEPSMIVDSQGTIYVESIRGVPGGLDLWRWYQPADGGPNTTTGVEGTLPFKYEGQPDGCGIFPANMFCSTAGVAPGGGDGDVAANTPDVNNIPNLAVVSLSAAEVTASHSTDRADMFGTPENVAAAKVAFDDRMWIDAVDDPNHVYMEYHDFGTTSQIFVQRSNDGGQTYNDGLWTAVDTATAPSVGPPGGNIAGQIKVDHTSCASRGNVYQIFVGPANLTDNSKNSSAYFNTAYVGVASAANLTSSPSSYAAAFKDYTIFSCGAGTTCPSGAGLGNLFPGLAVDNLGYVYATWSDMTDVYYSFSRTHGTTWSPAIKVTQNTSQAGKSNLFTWIAADANGHVAIAWYGADQSGNSNSISLNTKWNVFVSETLNGHAFAPTFTLSQATDHVNHTGQISTSGFNPLGSDRSLSDFFQIAIDPTNHLVNVAYDDNHAGTTVTYFTRQKQATSGIVTTGGCAGTCREADGEGDVPGRKGGKANFKMHHDNCNEQPDSEDFSDSAFGTDFHSTRVDSATFNDVAHSLTITGMGTNNGLPVAFTIVAVDSTLAAPGLFSITLSDGYTNSGSLLDGSITLQ